MIDLQSLGLSLHSGRRAKYWTMNSVHPIHSGATASRTARQTGCDTAQALRYACASASVTKGVPRRRADAYAAAT